MGTNLLNLSPFYLDGRTHRGARLRLLRLAFGSPHAACALFAALLTPNLPLRRVTAVISGSPFGFLAETLPGGSSLKSVLLPILRLSAFPGTFTVLRLRFPSKTSRGLRLVQSYTLNFTT